ncbi:MAG TPA: hypothetical protein DCO79_05340 [Spirochaeta sp.]|nr:hypothetical protein [Spirochaeta sp.]
MKKIHVILIVLVVVVITIAACALPPAIMGVEVVVINGHFLTDQIINTGGWIDKYYADGSYEVLGHDWDDTNEEWVQSYGARGTYEYNSDTHTMTRTATERWEWRDGDGWITLSTYYTEEEPEVTAWSLVDSYNQYFTTNGSYTVYNLNTDGTWEFVYLSVLTETSGGVEQTDSFKTSQKYTIDGDEIRYFQENSGKDFEDIDMVVDYRREWAGDLNRLAPDGIEWKKGKTVTFWYTETLDRGQYWNDGADALGDWEDWTYINIHNKTFTHMGDFMLEVSEDSEKSLK